MESKNIIRGIMKFIKCKNNLNLHPLEISNNLIFSVHKIPVCSFAKYNRRQ